MVTDPEISTSSRRRKTAFVRKLGSSQPSGSVRAECRSGEELQLGFGLGAPLDEDQRKWRRSCVIRRKDDANV